MYRGILVACLAVVGVLPHLGVDAAAPPKPAGKPKPKPKQASEIYVILKARIYEVDEAFHNKLAKAKWRSRAYLDDQESRPPDDSLFAQLKKQKPVLVGKKINVDLGKEGLLLT